LNKKAPVAGMTPPPAGRCRRVWRAPFRREAWSPILQRCRCAEVLLTPAGAGIDAIRLRMHHASSRDQQPFPEGRCPLGLARFYASSHVSGGPASRVATRSTKAVVDMTRKCKRILLPRLSLTRHHGIIRF
jgi:hypothetical protein